MSDITSTSPARGRVLTRPLALLMFAAAAAGMVGCASVPPSSRSAAGAAAPRNAPPPGEAQSEKAAPQALHRYVYTHPQMGTRFRLVLYAPDEVIATAARDAAFARIDELNAKLSDYEEQSELSRLSRTSGSGEAVKLSDDLWEVLSEAQRIARRSGGAFDVTVGPATRLWRRARNLHRMPRERRLERARAAIGYQKIQLDPEQRTATLTTPGMRLDLGGIAKGYAADEALEAMERHGVHRALVDAGGDVTLGDPPPDAPGWRVSLQPMIEPAAEEPEESEERKESGETGSARAGSHDQESGIEDQKYLIASNLAVATSGDVFQHVVLDGKRYSHIVDPRTALGLTNRIAATVIAPDGATADALASAVSVLGPEDGLELIESTPGAAAIIVRNVGGRLRRYVSDRVDELNVQPEEEK